MLTAGTRLGPYEIVAPLGAGGMGEVFKARDTRLDRSVAIKVLSAALARDPEFRSRFEREARAISSLNHPNICTLYDVGHENGTDYLVMELIEGESLADRLSKGPLPFDQIVRYGAQIAEALDRAHRAGVIHRDLKPGNVMLTKSGAKLLDFGLAKGGGQTILSAQTGQTGLSVLHTEQKPITREGTILGTYQYMAPEQLEGENADARTDIFALGAVLYEMATGKRAFQGKTRTSLIAAIVSGEPPPISDHHPLTPANLERVIKTCLSKDPEDRWQSARDVAIELRGVGEGTTERARPSRSRYLWPFIAAALAIATIVLASQLWRASQARRSAPPIRTLLLPPANAEFDFINAGAPPAISPDGMKVVFGAARQGAARTLWVRSLDSLTAQELPGTERGMYPFWSPDGRHIGFFSDTVMKRAEVGGGAPTVICNVVDGRGGTWSPDGRTIVFGLRFSGLFRVPAGGGRPTVVTKLTEAFANHRWPAFLPDGRHFVFLATISGAEDPANGIFVGNIDGMTPKLLMNGPNEPHYLNGWLLYARDRILNAQKLDPEKLELVGDPISLKAQQLESAELFAKSIVTISQAGTLVYQMGSGTRNSQLTWFDRTGKVLGRAGEDAPYSMLSLSPDEKSLAVTYTSSALPNVWILDLVRGARSRISFGDVFHNGPGWSPGGREILYYAVGKPLKIFRRSLDTGSEEKLLESQVPPGAAWMLNMSPDGRNILFTELGGATRADIRWFSMEDRKSHSYLATAAIESGAEFSPDGKWVAYQSTDAGTAEVYIAPFPPTGAKWQISTNGGAVPHWRGDGKELFYAVPAQNAMMSVPIVLGPTPQVGLPTQLFKYQPAAPRIGMYDVTRDGQRFLINTRIGDAPPPAPLIVVQKFDNELRAAAEQQQ